jgi:hypothetical protein
MAIAISAPYPNFFTPDGAPLEGGYVYIGVEGLNPIANPQAAYWDEALTIPAPAEVRVTGGYIVYNGAPARLYVAGNYSILVADKNGRTIYSRLYNTVYDKDLFLTEPRGTISRSMRTPASFNINLILDGGYYSWTNAGTSNYPTGCGAADLFALEVLAAPDGAGIIYQRVVDISIAYATERYSWERKSIDAGVTWSTWVYPLHLSDAVSTATADTIALRDANADIAFRDIDARDIALSGTITGNADITGLLNGIDFINGNAGTYGTEAISAGSSWVPPKGLYVFTGSSTTNGPYLQIWNGTSWVYGTFIAGLLLTDGINYRLGAPFNAVSVYYRKLA